MKKISSLLIPILIAIFTTIAINSLLDKKIETFTKEKNISLMGRKYADTIKDKSVLDKKLLSDKGDLFLLGSSEMGIDVPQNPLKLFPFKGIDYDVSCFGRVFCQDLQQATYLGSADLKENQKVACILSIQWFEDSNAISPYNFAINFSDVQFYKFLENPKISEENKKYYAERVYKFLTSAKKYPAEAFYAKIYLDSGKITSFEKLVFAPYYETKKYLLDIQDKALIYNELKELPDKNGQQKLKEVNWEEEYAKIKEENSAIVSTNQFNLDDKFYNGQFKDELYKHKGESRLENPVESKEFDDYKFFLSVCKDLNIEPYIILQPVNGWYYDYAGLTKDKREEYYDKVKKISNDNNIEVLDLSKNEYKKNFLIDAKHLGREGWLNASEGIYKHFSKK
ncbi:D-alanyl-lipoteichoic acid biosynthesis protein DltD [Clostridium beijerinckii]|nr:D-alanyl-lipoteichoic acid biosynthesis protein DltD [Clostridium beijerinckii]